MTFTIRNLPVRGNSSYRSEERWLRGGEIFVTIKPSPPFCRGSDGEDETKYRRVCYSKVYAYGRPGRRTKRFVRASCFPEWFTEKKSVRAKNRRSTLTRWWRRGIGSLINLLLARPVTACLHAPLIDLVDGNLCRVNRRIRPNTARDQLEIVELITRVTQRFMDGPRVLWTRGT